MEFRKVIDEQRNYFWMKYAVNWKTGYVCFFFFSDFGSALFS